MLRAIKFLLSAKSSKKKNNNETPAAQLRSDQLGRAKPDLRILTCTGTQVLSDVEEEAVWRQWLELQLQNGCVSHPDGLERHPR